MVIALQRMLDMAQDSGGWEASATNTKPNSENTSHQVLDSAPMQPHTLNSQSKFAMVGALPPKDRAEFSRTAENHTLQTSPSHGKGAGVP